MLLPSPSPTNALLQSALLAAPASLFHAGTNDHIYWFCEHLEYIMQLFKFSSYKMGVSMNSWFLVTGRIYFKNKIFKYI